MHALWNICIHIFINPGVDTEQHLVSYCTLVDDYETKSGLLASGGKAENIRVGGERDVL